MRAILKQKVTHGAPYLQTRGRWATIQVGRLCWKKKVDISCKHVNIIPKLLPRFSGISVSRHKCTEGSPNALIESKTIKQLSHWNTWFSPAIFTCDVTGWFYSVSSTFWNEEAEDLLRRLNKIPITNRTQKRYSRIKEEPNRTDPWLVGFWSLFFTKYILGMVKNVVF